MRRRYQVNLYTEHSKHLELIEHLMTFDKNKRSSELTMLLLAGYQVLYGKGDTGLDKSTSMLLDERDHLISLLASRLGQQPSPQTHAHAPPYFSQPSQATPPHSHHEEVREQEGAGNFRQEKVSPSEPPKPKERPEETNKREPSRADEKSVDAKKTPLPKKVYHQNDLTDEDPSIHEVPEPDLEEDIVDPLSLFD